MCRSVQTSLVTFLVSVGCMAAVVAMRPTPEIKYLALFVLTFSSIQVADALIWYSIHNKKNTLNIVASKYIVPLILSLELIISYYGAVYFLGWSNRLFEMSMWIVVIAMCIVWYYDCLADPITRPNSDGYLVWCNSGYRDIPRLIFLVFLMLPVVIAFPNGVIKAVVIAISLATWLWNYGNTAFGSRWCWSSNLVSVAALLLVLLGAK